MTSYPRKSLVLILIALLLLGGCVVIPDTQLEGRGYLQIIYKNRTRPIGEYREPRSKVQKLIFDLARAQKWEEAVAAMPFDGEPITDEDGKSIYEYALVGGVNPLLIACVDYKVPLEGGDAIYFAIVGGQYHELGLMLGAGLDVNNYCRDGNRPLLGAIDYGDPDMVEKLMRYGADPSLASKAGRTVTDALADRRNLSRLPDVEFNYNQIRMHLDSN